MNRRSSVGFSTVIGICLLAVSLCLISGCGGGGAVAHFTTGGGAANFFVATNGNDSWSGTLPAPNSSNTDGPFATIGRAQQAVRAALQNPQGNSSITVQIRDGIYFLTQGLMFTAADSGSASVQAIWENFPSETPVISGGMQLTGWTNTSGNIWQITLPSSTQYFEQLFYNHERRFRPRLGGATLGAYFRVAAPIFVTSPEPNCPDRGQTNGQFECFDRFQYTAGDPISAGWANLSPPSPNPCGAGSGPFPIGDIELYSFEQMGASKMRISCVDTTNTIIYLTGPIRIPTDPADHTSGFVAGRRYLVENVKDAFTQAGTWFLNRSVSPWRLTYLAQSGENPNTDTVIIPELAAQQPQVLVAAGLQNVTFTGLTFAHDNFTIPDAGYAFVRLDVGVTSAVSCQNCQNVTFDSDIITETSGTGIDFTTTSTSATSAHNTFQNGAIFNVGGHGIRVGSLADPGDTDANVPQLTTVQNTVIEGFGRVIPKAFGIAQGCNHDNVYTHNDIYDGYSGGINIGALNCPRGDNNSSGAFNNVAEFNHTYNLGQGVSNDFGCVYFNTSAPDFVPTGNKALNNRCHDVTDARIFDGDGYGGQGLYLDNYTGLVSLQNNLVYRVSGSAVAETCGPWQLSNSQNTIQNNILAFSREAVVFQGCTPSSASSKLFDVTNNLVLFDMGSVQGGCYSCLGLACASVLPATLSFHSNLYCFGSGCTLPSSPYAFFSSNDPPLQHGACAKTTTYATLLEWQALTEDLASIQANPGFANPIYPHDDFSLPAGSPGVGFVVFDPNQAGRTSSALLPPKVAAAFPNQSFDPATQF